MSTKKVFCEECRNDVSFVETSVQMVGAIREKAYYYIGKEAHCADCGSELFIPEFSDFNLRALYDVFRRENVLISLEQIREIPEKYAKSRFSAAVSKSVCKQQDRYRYSVFALPM